ncbi:uncharacterized protein LTR77_010726 [Saxophila tyrrhenica]|uniref:Major facilitator superfamily (MFS) profile domain-containing protein n=1 Tax=Saxophila tyrrhenica TaxID=1690608 RepID=A0AAV9NUJ0_9PEZI|nr:hypothetical protein LTR77_010726 [Saxophila tyrrhenica]
MGIGGRFLKSVVKNDAMKVDPPEIYNPRVFFLALCSCFGGTLFGMDIGIIGGAISLPTFQSAFGFSDLGTDAAENANANLSANIVSVMQAGAFFGALLAYPIADKLGRKPGLLIAATLAFIGGLLQVVSFGHLEPLYVGRTVEGLGLGAATMLTPTYISENSPRAIRGMLVAIYQFMEVIGSMVAFWINYGVSLNVTGNAQWQVSLAMQCLPPVLLFISMLFLNESPRWLARTDRWERANAVLSGIRGLPEDHPYVQQEILEMHRQLEEEMASVNGGTGYGAILREMFTVPGNRRRAFLSMGLMCAQQWTGTNAINYYAPRIFASLGLSDNTISLLATGVYGVVRTIAVTCFLLFVADAAGRRWSLMCSGFAMFLCMFYLGFYVRFANISDDAPVQASGYVALVAVYLFAAAFQLGWGPVCWIYVSEIPTSRLRGLNVALSAATQWLFNFAVARATPVMLTTVGKGGFGTYFIYGSFSAVMIVGVWFLIPETKGISLERMDELFGVANFGDIEDIGAAGRHTKGGVDEVEEMKH